MYVQHFTVILSFLFYQIMHIALLNIHWYMYMYQLGTPVAIIFFQFSEVHTEI